jgi:hypothetical protein
MPQLQGFEVNNKSLNILGFLAFSLFLEVGCAHSNIPNTYVEDTKENRKVLEFADQYRKAVETRNMGMLLSLASENYFDDMGTPQGDDDVDYNTLKQGLVRMRDEVQEVRYQISYRGVNYFGNHVQVDMLYSGWFKLNTPEGPQWRRRLEPHRLVLAKENDRYKILSGM